MKLRISMILIFLVLLTGCNSNIQNIFPSENSLPTIVKTSTIEPTNTPTPNPTSTPTLTPTNTPTPNPTSTPTLTPTITPTLGPTPIGGSGKILTFCNAGKENGFYEYDISTGNYSKQTINDADIKTRLPVELRLRGTSEKVIGRLLFEDPDQILESCCTEIIGISKDGNEILLSNLVDPEYVYWITADQPIMKFYISNTGYVPVVQQNDITNVVVINISDDATKGGLGNLYSVDLGKGIITTLFKGTNKNDEPYWGGFISPDGTKVAYMNNEGIWTIDIDGKNNQMIIPNGYRPDWSPDGKEIVFGKDGKIFTCSEDGSNIKQIVLPNSIGNQTIYYPEWVKMPGSQMIDFWSKSGIEWDLFDLSTSQYSIININSDKRLDAGKAWGRNKWSPDGKWFIAGFMEGFRISGEYSFLCNVEKHECQQLLIKKSEDSYCFPESTNWMP